MGRWYGWSHFGKLPIFLFDTIWRFCLNWTLIFSRAPQKRCLYVDFSLDFRAYLLNSRTLIKDRVFLPGIAQSGFCVVLKRKIAANEAIVFHQVVLCTGGMTAAGTPHILAFGWKRTDQKIQFILMFVCSCIQELFLDLWKEHFLPSFCGLCSHRAFGILVFLPSLPSKFLSKRNLMLQHWNILFWPDQQSEYRQS